MKKTVEEYVQQQKSPQKEICQRLREIILKNFPDIKEEMKLGVPWYEGKFYIVGLKDHVNLGFSLDKLSPEQKKLLQGSGKTMKHFEFRSVEEIDEQKITEMLKIV